MDREFIQASGTDGKEGPVGFLNRSMLVNFIIRVVVCINRIEVLQGSENKATDTL